MRVIHITRRRMALLSLALGLVIGSALMLAGCFGGEKEPAVITAIVIPYIRSKTTAQQQTEINAWVRIAVSAAEQIYVGSGRGQEKKAYVINWLAEHGVTLDETRLDAMIEAAVYDLKKGLLPAGGDAQ